MTKSESVEKFAAAVASWVGKAEDRVLYALVNNAGVGNGGLVDWVGMEAFRFDMEVCPSLIFGWGLCVRGMPCPSSSREAPVTPGQLLWHGRSDQGLLAAAEGQCEEGAADEPESRPSPYSQHHIIGRAPASSVHGQVKCPRLRCFIACLLLSTAIS